MTAKSSAPAKSTMDLIIEKFLSNLQEYPEFDKEMILKLTAIAKTGQLSKPGIVEKAIKDSRVDES